MDCCDHIAFVFCNDGLLENKARALSVKLNLVFIDEFNKTDVEKHLKFGKRYYLEFKDAEICLKSIDRNKHGPILSDFLSKSLIYRRVSQGHKKEAILRAAGVTDNRRPHVIDLTAGLGDDAFILASSGCRVTLIERNPVIFTLLENGFDRAGSCAVYDAGISDIVKRMKLVFMDASNFLKNHTELSDVIYLDPMYQKRRKSAAVRKEMQAFQMVVGGDEDAPKLLNFALKKARYRVVVKRPLKAPFLANSEPSFSIKGKTTRFDVFVISPFQ